MDHVIARTKATTAAVLFACLMSPSLAAAQATVPVIVKITELVQLNHDQDPGLGGIGQSLGDFYGDVSIGPARATNVDQICDNPPPTPPVQSVFSVPYVFFSEDDPFVDPSCGEVPWVFAADIPLSDLLNGNTVPVVIRIKDRDGGLGGDDDTPETIHLDIPFGGRWSGDVDWPQHCNRDAVEGSGARICWQITVGDDADGDGLLDDWEINGLDVDGDGTIDLNLPAMGANPLHKDLFVELDWRAGEPPQRAEVRRWKEAFAAAPINAGGVPNPDGLPGINLHVDTGALTENGLLVGDNLGGGNELAANFGVCSLTRDPGAFYPAKAANFDKARRGLVFRYGITSTRCCTFGPDIGKECLIDAQCTNGLCQEFGGQGEIGGNDFVVWNTQFQGSTLMHELGHTLNLHHGGDVDDNCKPNYVSIMNYDHFEIERLDGSRILDYSPPRQPNGARGVAPLGPLAENALDETVALDPTDTQNFLNYTDAAQKKRRSLIGAPVDWVGDGSTTDTAATVNIDLPDKDTGTPERCDRPSNLEIRNAQDPLTGYDDWSNVSLPFAQFGESSDGPVNPVDIPEPTDAKILANLQELNTADLALTKSGPSGPFEAGTDVDLSYTLQAANQGPNPALVVGISDTLPPGASVLSADPACSEDPAGTVACRLSAMLPGGSASLALSVRAPARCEGGLPVPIVNDASIANASEFAGPDPDPVDNTASSSAAVQDTTPPVLELEASPSELWPANHKFVPITITVVTADACDDDPTIRLVSITSNEDANGGGDGNTSPDVRGARFGRDDRHFKLRAERSGQGIGRVYTITYEAEDASGNVGTGTVTVTVPKSQGQ